MFTLLEVCPATASDEQSVPSESHALIPCYQHHTPVSVSRCRSHRHMLQGRRYKGVQSYFIKQFKQKSSSSLQNNGQQVQTSSEICSSYMFSKGDLVSLC